MTMKTNDIQITDLMKKIETGSLQLPDFQRGWVWDDERIKALVYSIIHNFPVGAAMFLEYGNNDIKFKYKPIEGAKVNFCAPTELILDGQQRLTSIFNSMYSSAPVRTQTDKGKRIVRFYYLDIEKALDAKADVSEVVLSVPETRIITANFGRDILLDLSTPENEFREKKFPLNNILDSTKYLNWQNQYYASWNYDRSIIEQFIQFIAKIVNVALQYKIPVITLDKDTPKDAVCQVFENVNTGGVSLTVFELVTAIFAMDDFSLREDWKRRQEEHFSSDLLKNVTATDFLTALTLLSTYNKSRKGSPISCKKRDVLNLTLKEYKQYADLLCMGFRDAEKLLHEECVYTSRDLPYSTQLIPLAAICSVLRDQNKVVANAKSKIKQWYWCGVFGELYGSANETRFALDITQVMQWIDGSDNLPKTCQDAYFNPVRLLSLSSRLSAAYKGIMALILKNQCKDFITGELMSFDVYKSENVDIHHIFPVAYSKAQKFPESKWNSIVNKTPITYRTNREIGGLAPSKYLADKIEKKDKVDHAALDSYLESHLIDPACCHSDNFNQFFVLRASKLLDAIQNVTGRVIVGRDSEEVVSLFGAKL